MRSLHLPSRGFAAPRRASSGLLLSWDARDLSLNARTGQVGSFTRSSPGTAAGSDGRIRRLVHSQPRWSFVDLDGDGVRETPGVLIETAQTNRARYSEDLTVAAVWLPVSGATSSSAGTFAGIAFTRIQHNGGRFFQSVPVVGDGTKVLSFFVRTDGVTGTFVTGIIDNTLGAWRVQVTVSIAANGVVTVPVVTNGALLWIEPWADGVYRIALSAPGVVASSDNRVFMPSLGNTAASFQIGGVQVEDSPFVQSYLPTTATAVNRTADELSFPFNALPQAMTLYADVIPYGYADAGQLERWYVQIGDVGATPPRLVLYNDTIGTGGVNRAYYNNGTTSGSAGGATTLSLLRRYELAAQLSASGGVSISDAIDGGTAKTSAATAVGALPATWASSAVRFGLGAFQMPLLLLRLRIAAGVRTLDDMRALI